MNPDQKRAVVEEVAKQIGEADAIFAIDYRGLSVTQAVTLRSRLGEADASFRVVKNRLTQRAADKAGAESLKEFLDGPTAFTFVRGDAALAAKALATFRRENQLLEFKGGTMDGQPLSADEIESISRLPGREVLQGQFVGVLASPITGLVRGLGSLVSGLAIQLAQIQEKGLLGGGEEPAVPVGSSGMSRPRRPAIPVSEAAAAEDEAAEADSEDQSSDEAAGETETEAKEE